MGTQQILFVVLSVIIVMIAVGGGLTLFKIQAVKSNRQACISDMNNFAAHTSAWWRTPASQGGGEKMQYLSGGGGGTNYIDMLGEYLGHNYNSQSNELQTENGSYQILDGGSYSVKFEATGVEYYNGNPINIVLTINLMSNSITIVTLN